MRDLAGLYGAWVVSTGRARELRLRELLEAVRGLALTVAARDYRLAVTERLDVAQDAVVRVHGRLGQCREPLAFGTWVRAVIRAQCVGHLRSRRRDVLADSLEPGEHLGGGADPEALASARQQVARLAVARETLSPALRLVFDLRWLDEADIPTIASRLRVTRAVVDTRLHRARREVLSAVSTGGVC